MQPWFFLAPRKAHNKLFAPGKAKLFQVGGYHNSIRIGVKKTPVKPVFFGHLKGLVTPFITSLKAHLAGFPTPISWLQEVKLGGDQLEFVFSNFDG